MSEQGWRSVDDPMPRTGEWLEVRAEPGATVHRVRWNDERRGFEGGRPDERFSFAEWRPAARREKRDE